MKIPKTPWLMPAVMSAAISIGLMGCVGFGGISRPELEAIYGPIDPHWIGPVRHIDNVLELGYIQDPATTGGKIVPYGEGNLEEQLWFSQVGLQRIKVYIKTRRLR